MDLEKKIMAKRIKIGIIGLGYVGLPTAIEFAKAGFYVTGFEKSQKVIEGIKAAKSHIKDVKEDDLWLVTQRGRFKATGDFSKLAGMEAILICVPTPLDKNKQPDINYITSALIEIKKYISKGTLIVLESTTYPGTTEEIVQPVIEEKGWRVGQDFYLAFSPERVDPGNKKFPITKVCKVVGGVTAKCTQLAVLLYSFMVEKVMPVSSPKTAEMTKLLENIFRIVNISMINEFALICDRIGVDVWEVIEAASTKPYGFMPFYPGPGVGGHCIPLDPFYLAWKVKEYNFYPRFIELSGEINDLMPHNVITKVTFALNKAKKAINGSRILVLGVAYKKDIDDTRESPALKVMQILAHKGAHLSYHDPYVKNIEIVKDPYRPHERITPVTLKSIDLTESAIKSADCILILTDHSNIDYDWVAKKGKVVVDTRNAIKSRKYKNIFHI
jgi:UDP-N-acetyl-D-glucosamine dehydrogenase